MGALPIKDASDAIYSLRYGSHEIALIPMTRTYFNDHTESGQQLKRQFIRVRNDPSIRYQFQRDPRYSLEEIPPPTFAEADLQELLRVIDRSQFASVAEYFSHCEAFLDDAEAVHQFMHKGGGASFAQQAAREGTHVFPLCREDDPPGGAVTSSPACPDADAFGAAEASPLRTHLEEDPPSTPTVAVKRKQRAGGVDSAPSGAVAAPPAQQQSRLAKTARRHSGFGEAPDATREPDGAADPARDPSNTSSASHPAGITAPNPRAKSRHQGEAEAPDWETASSRTAEEVLCDAQGRPFPPERQAELRRKMLDFKRAMRPLPCAVVFVYLKNRETSDCFSFMGRKINVIGYFACRSRETEDDDALPHLQVRKAILKAAGDRTLERVIGLACKLFTDQFFQAASRHFGAFEGYTEKMQRRHEAFQQHFAQFNNHHFRARQRATSDAAASTPPSPRVRSSAAAATATAAPDPEAAEAAPQPIDASEEEGPLPLTGPGAAVTSPLTLLLYYCEHISMFLSASWNNYQILKFLHDSAALCWAMAKDLPVEHNPPTFAFYEKARSKERGLLTMIDGHLLGHGWVWFSTLIRLVAQRGCWVQFVLHDLAQRKDRLIVEWLVHDPRARSLFANTAFTKQLTDHLDLLHSEIVRARETPTADTTLWAPQQERSYDGKVYGIFRSPLCGPFLTTIKSAATATPNAAAAAAPDGKRDPSTRTSTSNHSNRNCNYKEGCNSNGGMGGGGRALPLHSRTAGGRHKKGGSVGAADGEAGSLSRPGPSRAVPGLSQEMMLMMAKRPTGFGAAPLPPPPPPMPLHPPQPGLLHFGGGPATAHAEQVQFLTAQFLHDQVNRALLAQQQQQQRRSAPSNSVDSYSFNPSGVSTVFLNTPRQTSHGYTSTPLESSDFGEQSSMGSSSQPTLPSFPQPSSPSQQQPQLQQQQQQQQQQQTRSGSSSLPLSHNFVTSTLFASSGAPSLGIPSPHGAGAGVGGFDLPFAAAALLGTSGARLQQTFSPVSQSSPEPQQQRHVSMNSLNVHSAGPVPSDARTVSTTERATAAAAVRQPVNQSPADGLPLLSSQQLSQLGVDRNALLHVLLQQQQQQTKDGVAPFFPRPPSPPQPGFSPVNATIHQTPWTKPNSAADFQTSCAANSIAATAATHDANANLFGATTGGILNAPQLPPTMLHALLSSVMSGRGGENSQTGGATPTTAAVAGGGGVGFGLGAGALSHPLCPPAPPPHMQQQQQFILLPDGRIATIFNPF